MPSAALTGRWPCAREVLTAMNISSTSLVPWPATEPFLVAVVASGWLTRAGIAYVLGEDGRLRVAATAATPAELAESGQTCHLIIWDQASDPGGDPAEIIGALAGQGHVLVITGPRPATDLPTLLRAGARSLVTSGTGHAEFLAVAVATAAGVTCLGADLTDRLNDELTRQRQTRPEPLSRREIQTLRLVADGCTHRQVARRLGLTEETVNTYVKRIRAKLNAGNKAELTRKAVDLGYVGAADQTASHQPARLAVVSSLGRPA